MRRWWSRTAASDGGIRPLSWWWVGLYAAAALGIGATVTWWAWPPALESLAEATKAEVEAIRTGLMAAGGAGAVFTLLLAVRRQRSTEAMDAAIRHDAEQRRVTELYTAAVEQLGHDNAAVRLGALYALQRLGQNHPEQWRPIVSVWCAYLRMPLRDPDAEGVDDDQRAERRQELEVRLTVQRLLREHVHSGPLGGEVRSPRYWGDDLDVDLTGAALYNVDLSGCRVHPRTSLFGATFGGTTTFSGARFGDNTMFRGARFGDTTTFDVARFGDNTMFSGARFGGTTMFFGVTFGGTTTFSGATFGGTTTFDEATFGDTTTFDGATFAGTTTFGWAVAPVSGRHVWPAGWELQPAEDVPVPPGGNPDVVWGRLVQVSASVPEGSSAVGAEHTAEDASTGSPAAARENEPGDAVDA